MSNSFAGLEDSLSDFQDVINLMGLIATATDEIHGSDISIIRDQLQSIMNAMRAKAADVQREWRELEAAIPGSAADVQRADALWRLLEAASLTVSHACERRNDLQGAP